jgi:hypothetical protein
MYSLVTLISVLGLAGAPLQASSPVDPVSQTADAVLKEFESHELVGLGESHRSQEFHYFLRRLLQDPSFSKAVNTMVVEFGNARYQATVDRYVSGEAVPPTELSKVWRDITVPLAFDTVEYPKFFQTVRAVNKSLPADKKVRVILGDPPIPWEAVTTPEQFQPFAGRDTFYFQQVDALLKQGRKALLIYGAHHLLKRDLRGSEAAKNSAEKLPELADRYGSRLYSIWPVVGESKLASVSAYPTLLHISGHDLGTLSSKVLLSPGTQFMRKVDGKSEFYEPDPAVMPRLGDAIDALLFVSPTDSRSSVKINKTTDAAYIAEVRRRALILDKVFGFPISQSVDQEIGS